MKRTIAIASMLALFMAGPALGHTGSSVAPSIEQGWFDGQNRESVLLIETSTTFLDQALIDLSVAYDYFAGDDFSGLDLSGYTHVFLGMDGGIVGEPSILNAANFVSNGGFLHFYGGTCWEPFAIAVDAHLVGNDTADYCWAMVGGTPHSTVTDVGHYLANLLPGTYNFADIAATYYATRTTDGGLAVAAVNGDGYNHLFSKSIGAGNFDWCINSAYETYYVNPNDYSWGLQVVSNMLLLGPTATEESSWSSVKALY